MFSLGLPPGSLGRALVFILANGQQPRSSERVSAVGQATLLAGHLRQASWLQHSSPLHTLPCPSTYLPWGREEGLCRAATYI